MEKLEQDYDAYQDYETFSKTMDGLMGKLFDASSDEGVTLTPLEIDIVNSDIQIHWDYLHNPEDRTTPYLEIQEEDSLLFEKVYNSPEGENLNITVGEKHEILDIKFAIWDFMDAEDS